MSVLGYLTDGWVRVGSSADQVTLIAVLSAVMTLVTDYFTVNPDLKHYIFICEGSGAYKKRPFVSWQLLG